jgi:hypothetical protein
MQEYGARFLEEIRRGSAELGLALDVGLPQELLDVSLSPTFVANGGTPSPLGAAAIGSYELFTAGKSVQEIAESREKPIKVRVK